MSTPVSAPTPIAALATLPLFLKLKGRKALVVGGSAGASWKAELLRAAGGNLVERGGDEWTSADFAGAAIAVADLPEAEARRFAAASRQAGVPVGIVDRDDLSDFQFGTIINRSPVVISVSTDGAAPVLGQSIRAKIESVLPRGLSRWAATAKGWRARLKTDARDFERRRAFWRRFADAAWADPEREPNDHDYVALLQGVPQKVGSVTLVGAGPGDPELLTLKAVRALQRATVILYDQLVGPEILELARREAKRLPVGKSGHGPSTRQSEINRRIVELALAGETVVRLKGGDPSIFGRATEELVACQAAGVPVAIVPGVTAAQGAAASLGLSLTERDHARRVQYLTGHVSDGKLPTDIDWRSVADAETTTVLYMPRKTLAEFVTRAIAAGLNPSTPAVAIASATLPGEASTATRVSDIHRAMADFPPGAPVTVIIGWVARHHLRASLATAGQQEGLAS